MQNATCSEIHMEVLHPVLQVYSTRNIFHSTFISTWIYYVPFHVYVHIESNFWLHPEGCGKSNLGPNIKITQYKVITAVWLLP
jgi:hypothetical protein